MRLLLGFLFVSLLHGADTDWKWPPEFGKLRFTFEFRTRLETRTGVGFGLNPDLENPLFRTRIGAEFQPVHWLKLSAMGQDARAPLYGTPAPSTARDTMDLQEGYLEFFPDDKTGFGAVVGRRMVTYGEGRLIGVPQWGNTSRTFDGAQVYYRLPHARLEVLMLSIVKVLPDQFNRPELGDRLWGTYDSFPGLIPKGLAEFYVLRRDQNRPGGFTGVGTLGVTTFGGRGTGPLPDRFKYSLETAVQAGHVGLQSQRGYAWFSNLSRRVELGRPVDLSIEYKYASGSDNPKGGRNTTFDQLYPANHDKFGHEDLFGWRNIHNLRSLDTVQLYKGLAMNLMYDNFWLASVRDSLYNGQGRPIVTDAKGVSGRHVGQELDTYATYSRSGFVFGAGFGHLFAGEFLRKTTPGVNTRYLYVFQSYSFR
jgi:hypothetical protein